MRIVLMAAACVMAWAGGARAAADPVTTEAQFVGAVEGHAKLYADAANEMARGALRSARGNGLCGAPFTMKRDKGVVKDWTGTVETLSSTGDGYGVLAVRLSGAIVVKTWNNGLSDMTDKTLLNPSSQVMRAAMLMKEGQAVIFSGAFFPSKVDCLEETSMTQSGSMREPEFIFRFSDLRAGP